MFKTKYVKVLILCTLLSSILATPRLGYENAGGFISLNGPVDMLSKIGGSTVNFGLNLAGKLNSRLFYRQCSIHDTQCLINKSHTFLATFVDGIPELGIEKLDKMFIDNIIINTDFIYQELRNVEIEGLKRATVIDISFLEDMNLMHLSFETTLKINGDYYLNGTLFQNPVYGSGTTTYTIKKIQMDMLFLYSVVQRENGKHMLDFKGYRHGMSIKEGATYEYQNLFNGDRIKNKKICDFISKNWAIITNVFGKSFYDKIFDKIYDAIKKYSTSRDMEDIFLP